MPRIVVLFNLKEGVSAADYEAWARGSDAPTVNALPSVTSFTVHRSTGLLGGGEAPYQYVEVLDFTGMDALLADISAPPMPEIAAAFQGFAEAPLFIVTEDLA